MSGIWAFLPGAPECFFCFLEQEEKMDKLINSEMPAYVHLEGENFRKVLDAMDTAGKLVNSSHPRHARYHAQCVIALLLEDYFFTYDERIPGIRCLPGCQSFS